MEETTVTKSLFLENIEFLNLKYPHIANQLLSHKQKNPYSTILDTKIGLPTILYKNNEKQFYLHSKYNPIKEAETFITSWVTDEINHYIVYGFGLGYHIEAFLQKMPESTVTIIETNIDLFITALHARNFRHLFQNEQLDFIVSEQIQDIAKRIKILTKAKDTFLLIYPPSLRTIPSTLIQFKELLENYKNKIDTMVHFKDLWIDNFHYNIQHFDAPINELFGKYTNKTIIIVAAGPSLDKNKHHLKNLDDNYIIIAVGSAIKSLCSINVEPDFIVFSDPREIPIASQIEGVNLNIKKTKLIFVSNAVKKVISIFKGKKYIVFQKGFDLAEQYARTHDIELLETEGSVSPLAILSAIYMGSKQIIFVGLDLAYTGNKRYAEEARPEKIPIETTHLRKLKGNTEPFVYSSVILSTHRNWIEKTVLREKGIQFFNATEGGAYINGTTICTLEVLLNHLDEKKD